MARSRHTDPPGIVARRADVERGWVRPRVVERAPRPGDIHPVPKSAVNALLAIVPAEFAHGLRRVELRARQGAVGAPFAEYRRGEKIAILYSTPLTWSLQAVPDWMRGSMERFGARAERFGARSAIEGSVLKVEWRDPEGLLFWFAFVVLFHELGHHFARQYRRRRAPPRGRPGNEALADATARRIYRAFTRRMLEGRARRAATRASDAQSP